MTNPYRFDESLRSSQYECDNKNHLVRAILYEGPLEITLCLDPNCAKVDAKCTHQLPIPPDQDSNPRKYTHSICKWNDEGTMLTCQFCGRDGT